MLKREFLKDKIRINRFCQQYNKCLLGRQVCLKQYQIWLNSESKNQIELWHKEFTNKK